MHNLHLREFQSFSNNWQMLFLDSPYQPQMFSVIKARKTTQKILKLVKNYSNRRSRFTILFMNLVMDLLTRSVFHRVMYLILTKVINFLQAFWRSLDLHNWNKHSSQSNNPVWLRMVWIYLSDAAKWRLPWYAVFISHEMIMVKYN